MCYYCKRRCHDEERSDEASLFICEIPFVPKGMLRSRSRPCLP
jgi:hypothetical protein